MVEGELGKVGTKENRNYLIILFVAIIFVGFNLRPAITSVGPLMGTIRDDVGLENWSVGLLTSLPLVAFALASPIAPKVGNRFSNENALFFGLILLVCGVSIRSISIPFFIFGGTLLLGFGIAFCNVLLPGIIKGNFPAKVALLTSIYSTAMGIMAATASGVSVPLAIKVGLGWQVTLVIWILPAIAAIFIWFIILKKKQADPENDQSVQLKYVQSSRKKMWRIPLAWHVAFFMGFQSFLFYVTISWLPEILYDYGVSMGTAGWLLSVTQFIGLPASFFVPVIADRFPSQRGIVVILGGLAATGYSGLLFGSGHVVMIISIIFIGITLGGGFALALAFLGMRARKAQESAELSGMAQTLGYTLAAAGPILIGLMFDVTDAWTVPLITLITVSLILIFFGSQAGKNRYVMDE